MSDSNSNSLAMDIISILHESFLVTIITFFSLYFLIGGAYRVYFSSISKIPGSNLAALTWWFASLYVHTYTNETPGSSRYQFYYDFLIPGPKVNTQKLFDKCIKNTVPLSESIPKSYTSPMPHSLLPSMSRTNARNGLGIFFPPLTDRFLQPVQMNYIE
jgi:hypothetical protein